MARNTFLNSVLTGQAATTETPPPVPTRTAPVLNSMGAQLHKLKERDIVELDPELIEPSFINDRIDGGRENLDQLVQLIRDHGQQVPILVRPHPEKSDRYQIVYGRRRLRAAAKLGKPVRAVVRPLTDEELVIAQGQENSARADLSFIEKALFAAALEDRGFGRETIMASLAVDKTGLSRLISSAVKIPRDVIDAVGPAPKTGRDRWVVLAAKLEEKRALAEARHTIAAADFASLSSDERFVRLMEIGRKLPSARPQANVVRAPDGRMLATVSHDPASTTLKIDNKAAPEFGAYLAGQLSEIYAAWKGGADV